MADKKDKLNSSKLKGSNSRKLDQRKRSRQPGWDIRPGNPGTLADVVKVIESRPSSQAKVRTLAELPEFSGYPLGAPSIVEQARALKNDPQLIFEYVYDNIDWQPGWGVMKGPLGTLLDQSGNAWDQCSLLVALLTQAGYTASFVLGQIQLTTGEFDAWFGTNTVAEPNCCHGYAQAYNIPCDPLSGGSMIMGHMWVQVVVGEDTYVLDPSYKQYNRPTAVAVGGTVTSGNSLTVTVYDAGLSGGSQSVSHTVTGGDTLNTISTALSNAINSNSDLAAIGVTAGSTVSPYPAQFTISSRSSNPTTYALSTSGGATETLTVALQSALLPSILDYSQSTLLTDAESGATIDGSGNFVQNMNHTNVATDLTTYTGNLVSYINGNTVGAASEGAATVDDVLGGKTIVPITLPFTWLTALPYYYSTTYTWSTIPNGYRTTLQVQYFWVSTGPDVYDIDETFYADELAGGRLTLIFSGNYPYLVWNGTEVAAGSTEQTTDTPETAYLTVVHGAFVSGTYSYECMNIYPDETVLIANAWGNLGNGQLTYHQTEVAGIPTANNEASNGEWLSTVWFTWASQASRQSDLLGRMNNTYLNCFHQVGAVSMTYNDDDPPQPSVATDLQGIAIWVVYLSNNTTAPVTTATTSCVLSVALEASTCAQFNGITPGVSTATEIDKANRTALITLAGTVSVGDTLTITVNDPALSGSAVSVSYTTMTGDTLDNIALQLADALNDSASLNAIGIFALNFDVPGSSDAVISVASSSPNMTYYTSSVTGDETETITIVWSKIYLANTSNWSTGANIQSILEANPFWAAQPSAISEIGSYASAGQNVLFGDWLDYVLGLWAGWGYWVFYPAGSGALGIIHGGLAGGTGNSGPGQQGTPSTPAKGPGGQPNAGDPFGVFSGDFFYYSTDMTIGSQPFPYGLSFRRTYNSANQYANGPLGYGWTHNHAITATVGSDGLLIMGEQFATQGAASIAALWVTMDLLSDTSQPITKLITASLSAKWWQDQLVNNTVVVAFPDGNQIFVKQPGGSYTAPSSYPGTLTLTSGAYSFKTPQSIEFNFNTSGQITSWVSPNGVTVSYTYSGTPSLLSTVSNGMGRTLTLTYSSGRLSEVSDGTGRSVNYAYELIDGLYVLYTFTDSLSNETVYDYNAPALMTKYYLPANPYSQTDNI